MKSKTLLDCHSLGWLCLALLICFPSTSLGQGQSSEKMKKQDSEKKSGEPNKMQNQDDEPEYPPVNYSMDREAPVLIYDNVGGFRMRPPEGFVKTPKLQIFQDGTVKCGSSSTRIKNVEMKLPAKEVRQFIETIVNERKLYDIESAAIKEMLDADKNRPRIADAGTTLLKMKLERGDHEVRVYALPLVASQFPDMDELQNVAKIEKACNWMSGRVHFETSKNKEEILGEINKQVKAQFPKLEPLTIHDIYFASQSSEGKLTARFERELEVGKDKKVFKIQALVGRRGGVGPYSIKVSKVEVRKPRLR